MMAARLSNRILAHDNSEFMWGNKKTEVSPVFTSYKSMRYGGEWYHVNDCVFVYPNYVGKLMKLYQEQDKRMIRVRWFLRPEEFVVKVPTAIHPKEVFIAMGGVKGVENTNLVEKIIQKAIVICTARHKDNPHVEQDSQFYDSVDFFFRKAYDAEAKKFVDIHKIDVGKKPVVRNFFNKPEWIEALKEITVDAVAGENVEPINHDVTEGITGADDSNKRARIL